MRWPFRRSPAPRLRLAARHRDRGRVKEAFAISADLARSGCAEAAYNVGVGYLEGKAVPVSRRNAGYWLEQSAKQGYAAAQTLLADLLLQGLVHPSAGVFDSNSPGEPDFRSAALWARQAAEAGSPGGQALLAFILSRGPETMRDDEAARHWYRCAASHGSPHGSLGYALAILKEDGHETEAVPHLRTAAERGLPAAIYLLGVMTEHGIGTSRDLSTAAALYRQAAEAGHPGARRCWGKMLLDGVCVTGNKMLGETFLRRAAMAGDADAASLVGRIYAAEDYAEAAIWFERAAQYGHRRSAHQLGLMYLSGTGVSSDQEEAVRWFQVAATKVSPNDLASLVLKNEHDDDDIMEWLRTEADAGDHIAELNYAICLAMGAGTPRDDPSAIRYLRRAARHVPAARYWYGLMMAEGRGVPLNLAKSRYHFDIAMRSGHTDAAVALGEMLANGRGGHRDMERAMALFQWAANRHSPGACFALGVIHTGTNGVQADLPVARSWFLAAANHGHLRSCSIMGKFMREGIGGDEDMDQARHWLELAAAKGDSEAREALMKPGEVA